MKTGMLRIAATAMPGMLCLGVVQAAEAEWTYLGAALPEVTSLAISPEDPDVMLARVSTQSALPVARAVWMSVDGGVRWQSLDDGGRRGQGGQLGFLGDGRGLVPDEGAVLVLEPGEVWGQWVAPHDAPPMAFGDVAIGAGDVVYVTAAPLGGTTRSWDVHVLDLEAGTLQLRSPPLPPDHGTIKLLAADPQQAGVVVALSDTWVNPWPQDTRLWVSTDGGLSWNEETQALPSRALTALNFDDSGWLATFAHDNWNPQEGIYRSNDHGRSWELLPGDHTEISHPTGIARDPSAPGRLMVSSWNGLHLSEDGGMTWQHDVANSAERWLSGVSFAKQGGEAFVTDAAGGLFKTDTSLQTLAPLGTQLGAMMARSVAVNPASAAEVAAVARTNYPALALSENGGMDWTHEGGWRNATGAAYGPDGRLYVTGQREDGWLGVRNSEGAWTALMTGFDADGMTDLDSLVFGASAQHLLVSARIRVGSSSQTKIRASKDGGANWVTAYASAQPSRYGSLLLNASGEAGQRFLALMADTVLHDPALLLSADGGENWSPAGAGLPGGLRNVQLCTTGTAAPRAYLSALENNQPQLFRSDDDGLSWQRTSWSPGWPSAHIGSVTALGCDPDGADTVVMGGREGLVLRSTDGGDSFVLLGDDLAGQTFTVNAFAWSPARLLYAATAEGVWAIDLPESGAEPVTNLSVVATGARSRPLVTLSWDGGAERVLVRRNSELLEVVENTGSFHDRPRPGELTATYQVCNADGGYCAGPAAARR